MQRFRCQLSDSRLDTEHAIRNPAFPLLRLILCSQGIAMNPSAVEGSLRQRCCHTGYVFKTGSGTGQRCMLRGRFRKKIMRPPNHANRCMTLEASASPRSDALRKLLAQPGIIKGPCCHDGLSAKLIEQAGFQMAFMSGFGVSASRVGAPDTNLLSYQEVLDQGRNCLEATQALPVIGDGDTGFGNALNVKRTVKGFMNAGFAGILIEDQAAPKSCGHVRGKRVVSRGEAVARIRAAADARDESKADIVLVARTDARQAESLEEALWRVAAFADAGADVLFVDALETRDEMRALCSAGGSAASLPKMANNLEGGGRTPLLPPEELEQLGFKLVAYPLSLLGVSMRAMQSALQLLKVGQLPPPNMMPSFQDIQETIGFPDYFAQAERYAESDTRSSASKRFSDAPSPTRTTAQTSPEPSPSPRGSPASSEKSMPAGGSGIEIDWSSAEQPQPGPSSDRQAVPQEPEASEQARRKDMGADSASQAETEEGQRAVESRKGSAEAMAGAELSSLDEELSALGGDEGSSRSASAAETSRPTPVVEPDAIVVSSTRGSERRGEDASTALRRARFLRVKITETATGSVRLETRLPSQFVDGMATVIPQVAGVDLEELIRETKSGWTKDQPVADFQAGTERVQIYLDGLA